MPLVEQELLTLPKHPLLLFGDHLLLVYGPLLLFGDHLLLVGGPLLLLGEILLLVGGPLLLVDGPLLLNSDPLLLVNDCSGCWSPVTMQSFPSSVMFSMLIKSSFQRPIFDLHDSVFVFIVLIEYS